MLRERIFDLYRGIVDDLRLELHFDLRPLLAVADPNASDAVLALKSMKHAKPAL